MTLSLLAVITACAQSRASEANVEYQRKKYPAATIEVPYPAEVVEKAIDDHMARKGSPGSSAKDFRLYRGVKLNNEVADLYVKVERKSRREKEASVVYMVAGRPNETITARTSNDNFGIGESKDYLNNVVSEIEAYYLVLNITKQDDAINSAEKKLNTLLSDSTDLSKKKIELEDKIGKNSIGIQSQKLEIEKQRQIMEALKAKKKQ